MRVSVCLADALSGCALALHQDATATRPHADRLQAGGITDAEMFRTFNMGIGLVIVVSPEDASTVQQLEPATAVLGAVSGTEGVELK